MAILGRHSMLRYASRSLGGVAGIVLFFVGGLFFGITLSAFLGERRWADAERLSGRVVGKEMHPATSKKSTAYLLTIAIPAADGRPERTFEHQVPVAAWEEAAEGDAIDVQVRRDSEGTARVPRPSQKLGLAIGMGAGGTLGLAGAALLATALARAARRARVARQGQPAAATVREIRASQLTVNKVNWPCIDFVYRDAAGVERQENSGPLPPGDVADLAPGDIGEVRYDAGDPSLCVWIGTRTEPGA